MSKDCFEQDTKKDFTNQVKRGVSFSEDLTHSEKEKRYYCFGKVVDGILTVRFTYRVGMIRIFGAGYWREGRKIYEREN